MVEDFQSPRLNLPSEFIASQNFLAKRFAEGSVIKKECADFFLQNRVVTPSPGPLLSDWGFFICKNCIEGV